MRTETSPARVASLGPHRKPRSTRVNHSDEAGNWKIDSEISLIWPWFHSLRALRRVLVLEPGEKHQKQHIIYIYYHILSIVARYSWCHVTTNPMTWSHDFTVLVFVTADSSDSTDQGHGYDDSKLTVMLKSAMSNLQSTHETILQVRFIGLLFCQFFPFCDWHGLTWIH